jgi:hypothetical protein
MIRALVLVSALLVAACSSSSSGSAPSGGAGSCPNVAGTWKVTQHCDPQFIGQDAKVTQNGCSLTFDPPFNGFTGSVTSDDKISLSGPQTCSGTVSDTAITMTCTPGTCTVALGH